MHKGVHYVYSIVYKVSVSGIIHLCVGFIHARAYIMQGTGCLIHVWLVLYTLGRIIHATGSHYANIRLALYTLVALCCHQAALC